MATRLYLGNQPQTTVTGSTVGFDAGWEKTTGATRKQLTADKFSSAMVTTTIAGNGTSGNDTLLGQWISLPLSGAQTITGTFGGQARFSESSTSLDARVQAVVYVIQSDLTTVRGTLIAMSTAALASEFNTSLRNITIPLGGAAAVSSVSAQDGDRIVVELGFRQHATFSANGSISTGDNNATDLPVDQTTTTANNPWVEFSQNLTFKSPELVASQVVAEAVLAPSSVPLRASQVVLEVVQSTLYQDFRAQSDGSSSVAADLTLPPSLAATIAGSSSVTADLTVSGGGGERVWGTWID